MRVLIVLLGLAALPMLASVSQTRPESSRRGHKEVKEGQRAKSSAVKPAGLRSAALDPAPAGDCQQQGQHDGADDGCGSAPPPPPPPPPPSGAEIHGVVFADVDMNSIRTTPPDTALANWTVILKSSTGATTLATTDASGNYAFTGLTSGTYTVCEALPVGFFQSFPVNTFVCDPNVPVFGYSFTLVPGQVQNGADFLNWTF